VVGRFFHATQVIVHPGGIEFFQQRGCGQDGIDAQAPAWLALEAPGAIVEPGKDVISFRVLVPEGVGEPPIDQALPPFPFFGQKAGLALA
jgi:hypothetical protein